jgi:hypothetical protein
MYDSRMFLPSAHDFEKDPAWRWRRCGLPLRSPDEEAMLVGQFCALAPNGRAEESEEDRFLRRCFLEPDGWDEEAARMQRLGFSPDPQWAPPRIDCWPP